MSANSLCSETSKTSLTGSVQCVSKSPMLRGIVTPSAGYTTVGALEGSSVPPLNRSGAVGGTPSSTRFVFTRAITCALPCLSVNSALTVILPGDLIVSVGPEKSPNEVSTKNVASFVTSFLLPSASTRVAVKPCVGSTPFSMRCSLVGGSSTSIAVPSSTPELPPHAATKAQKASATAR